MPALSPEESDEHKLRRLIKESVDQWTGLDELLATGRLKKQSGNWYRLVDAGAFREISRLIRTIRADRSGKVTSAQLEKPGRTSFRVAGVPYPSRPKVVTGGKR